MDLVGCLFPIRERSNRLEVVMSRRSLWILLPILLLAFSAIQCSNNKLRAKMTAEERLKHAKELYNKHHYLDAKTEFQVLVVSGQGSAVADEAQYYLAQCYYHLKDYVTAAAEFQRLVRMYPSSEWVDDAQYMIGMCYYKLSPPPGLDQEFTLKAIDAFQRFLEDFPTSDLRPEAEKRMRELRNKLAEKEWKNGELYRKMGYYRSALIYYDSVLKDYYDTPWAERALYQKGRILEKLKRYDEAVEAYQEFVRRFPRSKFLPKVRQQLAKTREKLARQSASLGDRGK